MNSFRIIGFAFCAVFAIKSVTADELPMFKPGLWEFTRTVVQPASNSGGTKPIQQCTDPIIDMKKKWAVLVSKGCKFTPIKRAADRYSYTSSCPMNGQVVTVRSVVQVFDDSTYQVTTAMRRDGQVTETLIIARRAGDCAGH